MFKNSLFQLCFLLIIYTFRVMSLLKRIDVAGLSLLEATRKKTKYLSLWEEL